VHASLYRLLRLAQHAAWQARDFTVLTADTRAEEVEVAALLYYVPDLLFWIQARDLARQLARLRRKMPYHEAETSVLGFPLVELRLAMMAAWQVPEVTRDLLTTKPEQPRQIILKTCLDIAHFSRHGWWDEHLPDLYQALAGVIGSTFDDVATTVHINAVKVARYGRWNASAPSAAWLPMLPGVWPNEALPDDEDDQPPATRRSASQSTSAGVTEPPPTAPATRDHNGPVPDARIFKETLRTIETHLDNSLTLNQMSAQILRGLHSGLGLTRLLFAMVTPDGRRVKTRFTLGIPAGDPMRHFEFELAGKDLFCQLMGKSQGIWMNPDNRERLWPKVDPGLRAMIGEADFFAMALYNGKTPIGLIYADRGHTDFGLDAHTYTDFKIFCLQAARGLSKLSQ
jgi:hypothetical protein